MAEQYLVDVVGFGEPVDVLPLLREAVARCPYKHDFSLDELASLVRMAVVGKYIPVATLDRIEGRRLHVITSWVIKRARTEYRIGQILDPDMRRMRPFVELFYFPDVPLCEAAEKLRDRWLEGSELSRLPLDSCTSDVCHCDYVTCSRKRAPQKHPDRNLPSDYPDR